MSIIDVIELATLRDNAKAFDLLNALRAAGWCVAVHNDYSLKGVQMTFWLFTHSGGLFVKGEAVTDIEALELCATAAKHVFAPSP